jgi:hypothetical protein
MSATVRNIRSFTDHSGPLEMSVRRLVLLGLDSYSLHNSAGGTGRGRYMSQKLHRGSGSVGTASDIEPIWTHLKSG